MSPVGILGIPRGLKICVVLLIAALLVPFIERNGPNASVLHHFRYRQKKTIGGGKAERFPNSGTALLQKQNAVVALVRAFFGEMVLRDARTSLVDHSSLQKIEFSGDTVPCSGKIVPGRVEIKGWLQATSYPQQENSRSSKQGHQHHDGIKTYHC